MDKEGVLKGGGVDAVWEREYANCLAMLDAPRVPLTYDAVVEDGITMSRLFPISVAEAERERRERKAKKLFSLASFL